MITLLQAKSHLRIDDESDDLYLAELIEVSQFYIDKMVGEAYKTDTKAVKLSDLLQKKLIADMYMDRGTEIEAKTKQDKIVTSILDSLSNYITTV